MGLLPRSWDAPAACAQELPGGARGGRCGIASSRGDGRTAGHSAPLRGTRTAPFGNFTQPRRGLPGLPGHQGQTLDARGAMGNPSPSPHRDAIPHPLLAERDDVVAHEPTRDAPRGRNVQPQVGCKGPVFNGTPVAPPGHAPAVQSRDVSLVAAARESCQEPGQGAAAGARTGRVSAAGPHGVSLRGQCQRPCSTQGAGHPPRPPLPPAPESPQAMAFIN